MSERAEEITRNTLIDSLGIDAEECDPSAHIRDGLGASSIDDLDIVFRIGRATDTRVTRPDYYANVMGESEDPERPIDVSKQPWKTPVGTVERLREFVDSLLVAQEGDKA